MLKKATAGIEKQFFKIQGIWRNAVTSFNQNFRFLTQTTVSILTDQKSILNIVAWLEAFRYMENHIYTFVYAHVETKSHQI